MSKYWKLLILRLNQYIECETEEEVIHLIESLCKDMEQERIYKHHTIETQHPNYNFEHVTVFDSSNVRQFLYFFDTIEEERDSLGERIEEMNTHYVTDFDPCIDTPLIRDLAYESQDMIHKICKEFDERTSSLMARIKELESYSESNQLDELIELQQQRDNLVNKNAELESKLIRYAGEIEKLKYELSNANRTLEKIRDTIYPF